MLMLIHSLGIFSFPRFLLYPLILPYVFVLESCPKVPFLPHQNLPWHWHLLFACTSEDIFPHPQLHKLKKPNPTRTTSIYTFVPIFVSLGSAIRQLPERN